MTSKIVYNGDLRTTATHLKSGNNLITDAPIDNHGKGEMFSPTDLVATALGSCMLTIMGIVGERLGVSVTGAEVSINKVMQSGPRKIAAIDVNLTLPHNNYTDKQRTVLENAARNCPVALSLDKDLKQNISFVYLSD